MDSPKGIASRIFRRESLHNEDSDHPEQTDLYVRKNRNGPTDTVNLTWIKESMRFTNHSHLDEPDGGYFAESGNDSF